MAQAVVLFSSTYDANSASGFASLLVQGANGLFQVAANSTGGNSAFGNPATNDPILGVYITGMWWSTDGTITVKRGANVVATMNGSDHMVLADGWKGIPLYPAATLEIDVSSANSVVYVDVKKKYN